MKILHTILEWTNLYIFTDNPEVDILYFIDRYENWLSQIPIWYATPKLEKYKFLWNEYDCISLWFDNECDTAEDSQEDFNNMIK